MSGDAFFDALPQSWQGGAQLAANDHFWGLVYIALQSISGRVDIYKNGGGVWAANFTTPAKDKTLNGLIAYNGNNLAQFMTDGQKNALPTIDAGGYIGNFKDFYNFMLDKANNYPDIEVSGFKVVDRETEKTVGYFVLPWKGNTFNRSVNDFSLVPSEYLVLSQYHTHGIESPLSGHGPSRTDAEWSQRFGIPVHVINRSGEVWQVYYRSNDMIPLPANNQPYGTLILGARL